MKVCSRIPRLHLHPPTQTMFPPCVRDTGNSENFFTVVAKVVAPNAAALNWLSSTIGADRDAQAAALVQLERVTDSSVYYAVLTLPKRVTMQHVNRDLRERLEPPPHERLRHLDSST